MKRLIVFSACLLLVGLAGHLSAAGKPNIIIIMTDDMGWSDLGCFGGEIRTPNLDQLAGKGLRFTQFYNTARCCPTRAALLTGLYSHQAGMGHMIQDHGLEAYRGDLNNRCVTIAEALRPAGYRNYAVGKWHVCLNTRPEGDRHNWPLQRGFDRYYGILTGAANYYNPKTLCRDNEPVDPLNDPAYKPGLYYLTDAISEHAVRFINDHAREQTGKPFFMYVAYTAAHWPIHAKEQDVSKYKGMYDAGYDAIRRARWEKMKKLGLVDPKWAVSPTVGEWNKEQDKPFEARCMEVYAAMVDCMDQGVGRIVAALKQQNLFENTLVFYLQDNGACAEEHGHNNASARSKKPGTPESDLGYGEKWANVSNTPLRYYKHWEHEGGISTPLIAHWPAGISPARHNQFVRDPGHLIDLMATCVDLAGAQYPAELKGQKIQPMEGVSLAPAFKGGALQRPKPIFWEHEGNRAVRDGKWKLVSAHRDGDRWELYDLQSDRAEMRDLAAKMPDKVSALSQQWENWSNRVGVQPWPLTNKGKTGEAKAGKKGGSKRAGGKGKTVN